jgi:hypothetical protein
VLVIVSPLLNILCSLQTAPALHLVLRDKESSPSRFPIMQIPVTFSIHRYSVLVSNFHKTSLRCVIIYERKLRDAQNDCDFSPQEQILMGQKPLASRSLGAGSTCHFSCQNPLIGGTLLGTKVAVRCGGTTANQP